MNLENIDYSPETSDKGIKDAELGAFQNPIYEAPHDLMPKIRFTTDAEEARQAAQADRSDPLHLPDTVIYVERPDEAAGDTAPAAQAVSGFQNPEYNIDMSDFVFQNPTYDIDTSSFVHDTGADSVPCEYAGPSLDEIERRLKNDTEHLTFAQQELDRAIERGEGVMTAMHLVNSSQAVLDADHRLYQEALKQYSPEAALHSVPKAPGLGGQDASVKDSEGEVKLGSVSHAKWELEKAYEHGSQVEIKNATRHLAEEKAKEAEKKMGI